MAMMHLGKFQRTNLSPNSSSSRTEQVVVVAFVEPLLIFWSSARASLVPQRLLEYLLLSSLSVYY